MMWTLPGILVAGTLLLSADTPASSVQTAHTAPLSHVRDNAVRSSHKLPTDLVYREFEPHDGAPYPYFFYYYQQQPD